MKTRNLLLACAVSIVCSPTFAATITAIKNGNWSTKGTWDLNREPADNDIVVIPVSRTVLMKNTPYAKNSNRPKIILNIYGTLDFSDAGSDKLYLDQGSKVQIFLNGKIVTNLHSDEVLAIKNGASDNTIWDGDPATIHGPAYAIATSSGFSNGVLPLKFLSFDVERTGQGTINLTWSTAEEVNTSYFDIELFDQQTKIWEAVGTVNASGDESRVTRYSFNFTQNITGPSQFRLKQVDRDGKFTYSAIRVINDDGQSASSLRYDTRSRTIYFTGKKLYAEKLHVQLFDVNGNVRFRQKVNGSVESLSLPSSLNPGVYVIQVKENSGRNLSKRIAIY